MGHRTGAIQCSVRTEKGRDPGGPRPGWLQSFATYRGPSAPATWSPWGPDGLSLSGGVQRHAQPSSLSPHALAALDVAQGGHTDARLSSERLAGGTPLLAHGPDLLSVHYRVHSLPPLGRGLDSESGAPAQLNLYALALIPSGSLSPHT